MFSLAVALVCAAAPAPPRHLGPKVPARVERIVTVAPSLSEIVLALGAGDRLVGVTRFDDDPRTAKLPRIGGYNDPQPEAVLALRPDLVLAHPAPENRGPVETLARLGVPVETFPLQTIEDIEEAIREVGALLGRRRAAADLDAGIESARAQARRRAAQGPHPRVLLVFGLDPLVVAGPASFAGELLRDVGGVEVVADRSRPFLRLPEEAAVRAQPDLVVLCGVLAPIGRPPLRGVRARLAVLRSNALLHPGPRVPQALEDLESALAGSR